MVLCISETHLLFCAFFVVSELIKRDFLRRLFPPTALTLRFIFRKSLRRRLFLSAFEMPLVFFPGIMSLQVKGKVIYRT